MRRRFLPLMAGIALLLAAAFLRGAPACREEHEPALADRVVHFFGRPATRRQVDVLRAYQRAYPEHDVVVWSPAALRRLAGRRARAYDTCEARRPARTDAARLPPRLRARADRYLALLARGGLAVEWDCPPVAWPRLHPARPTERAGAFLAAPRGHAGVRRALEALLAAGEEESVGGAVQC